MTEPVSYQIESSVPPDVAQRYATDANAINPGFAENDSRFRRVVEASPSAMVMINRDGRIEMVNLQTERVFGYLREEMVGQSVEMLLPLRFRGHHPGLRHAFFAAPQSRPMGAGRDLFGRHKDGSEFPVEIGLNPIEMDQGPMVLSAIVDISQRRHLEERFRRVVEAAPNAMIMITAGGLIEMVNAQAERVFGYTRVELLGKPVETLVPARFRGHHAGLRQAFFADPLARPMGAGRDLFALKKDGSEFPVEIGLNPIEMPDGTMVLSSIVDISDRRDKERKIELALKEKDILLGEIHHRVKNNLQIIHSLLDLQSAQVVDPIALEMLRDSQNRVRSMALIHQTLYQSTDFARVDFGSFLDTFAPMLMASYAVNRQQTTLSISADGILLPISVAIPCGLIVNELVSNALKHAFPNQEPGAVSVELRHDAGGMVLLTVTDDGVGLPGRPLDSPVTSLGLQLVALLTDQLHGTLSVNSENPTSFTICFPVPK